MKFEHLKSGDTVRVDIHKNGAWIDTRSAEFISETKARVKVKLFGKVKFFGKDKVRAIQG